MKSTFFLKLDELTSKIPQLLVILNFKSSKLLKDCLHEKEIFYYKLVSKLKLFINMIENFWSFSL